MSQDESEVKELKDIEAEHNKPVDHFEMLMNMSPEELNAYIDSLPPPEPWMIELAEMMSSKDGLKCQEELNKDLIDENIRLKWQNKLIFWGYLFNTLVIIVFMFLKSQGIV